MDTSLKSDVKKIVVVVSISAYEKYGSRKFDYKGFSYRKKMFFKIPLYLESDYFMLERNDSVNAIIAKNIDAMTEKFKEAAKDIGVNPPDQVEIVITDILSAKDAPKDEETIEWKTIP
jgi:hypothetical protein